MAKKYVNFRVGGVPERKEDNYTVWTNDLLSKLIASKTVIEPSKSTFGHRLLESEVIFEMEEIYVNSPARISFST